MSTSIYYHPEAHGLNIVASVDLGENYDFDMHVIWLDAGGRHFYASDSGCSCPVPFEGYENVDALEVVTRETYDRVNSVLLREGSRAFEFTSALRQAAEANERLNSNGAYREATS